MKKLTAIVVACFAYFSAQAAVKLQWDANDPKEGIQAYLVYRVAPTSVLLGTTVDTSFVISPSATPVSYAVVASNIVGLSSFSASVTPPIAPSAPANPTFKITRNPQSLDVVLSWTASPVAEAISSYAVYELVLGTWVLVGSSPTPTLTVPALSLASHTFCVKSVNIWGESPASVSIVTPLIPSTPSGLKVSAIN